MTAEMLNEFDKNVSHERDGIQQKVDDFCMKLENMIAEWKMESIIRDNDVPETLRYLIADHVMNIYAVIIGMRRLIKPVPNSSPVDDITLRAARKVAEITLDFTTDPARTETTKPVYYQYV